MEEEDDKSGYNRNPYSIYIRHKNVLVFLSFCILQRHHFGFHYVAKTQLTFLNTCTGINCPQCDTVC